MVNGWCRQQLPKELGNCYTDRFEVETGLSVVKSCYRPTDDLVEDSVKRDGQRMLALTFSLTGESGYVAYDGSSLAFRSGYTTASSFSDCSGTRQYHAVNSVDQVRILVDESILMRYLGTERSRSLMTAQGVRQLGFRKTSPANAIHVAALARMGKTALTNVLDLQIHTLSLLSEQFRDLCVTGEPEVNLTESDIEKLERAKNLMTEQLDRPLTLAYLAAMVGMSEFKLKQGCLRLFNSSPGKLLHELRMRKAWDLLTNGCQVAQAAWQVGYEHPSNFSIAFTKFFQRTPKSVLGKRSG